MNIIFNYEFQVNSLSISWFVVNRDGDLPSLFLICRFAKCSMSLEIQQGKYIQNWCLVIYSHIISNLKV